MSSAINTMLHEFDSIFRNSGDCYKYLYHFLAERDKEKFPKRICLDKDPFKRRKQRELIKPHARSIRAGTRHPHLLFRMCNNWDIKLAIVPDVRKRYFAKCPTCDNYFSTTKDTFFENRKLNILVLFKLIAICEYVNFDLRLIREAISKGNFLVESNYPSPDTGKGEISTKRLNDLLKDLIAVNNREEILNYGILKKIRHPKSEN